MKRLAPQAECLRSEALSLTIYPYLFLAEKIIAVAKNPGFLQTGVFLSAEYKGGAARCSGVFFEKAARKGRAVSRES